MTKFSIRCILGFHNIFRFDGTDYGKCSRCKSAFKWHSFGFPGYDAWWEKLNKLKSDGK